MSNAANLASAAGTGFFRNAFINGNFDIWQRGTSGFGLQNEYSADRWMAGTATTGSVSRGTFTAGQTDVPNNPTYYLSFNKTGTGDYAIFGQKIEDVKTFAGQTVTLSFWAKANAATTLQGYVYQVFGSGGSTTVATLVAFPDNAVTTAWKKFTLTISIPSVSGKTIGTSSYIAFYVLPGSSNSSWTGTFDFAQAQVELGSVATPFERRQYGAELALCQRYYYKVICDTSGKRFCNAYSSSTTQAIGCIFFPVSMRVQPSALEQSGTASDYSIAFDGTGAACNAVPTYNATTTFNAAVNFFLASGMTLGRGALLSGANSNSYLAWSAEL